MSSRKRTLSVIPFAAMIDPDKMGDVSCAVVVDILRATTTILAALSAGAKRIIPLAGVEEARNLAAELSQRGEKLILAGERGGKPLSGFDLGNSPGDFIGSGILAKTILFTTTNGTLALKRACMAKELITGAFGNAASVIRHLVKTGGNVAICCAGQEGSPAQEDLLFAGWLAAGLSQLGFVLDEEAEKASLAWGDTEGTPLTDLTGGLEHRLNQTPHGRTLIQLGFASDIRFAAQWDTSQGIPRFSPDAERGFLVGNLT